MTLENKALVLDLVAWLAEGPRPYRAVMDAWRTSCPRLPVWEDAVDHGFVSVQGQTVSITDAGRAFLSEERHVAAGVRPAG